MASSNVIIDPEPQSVKTPAVSVAAESVRPKAFRRPPGWVAPTPAEAPSATIHRLPVATEPRSAAPAPVTRDRLYGVVLVTSVIGINLLAAGLLSAWESREKPAYSNAALPQGGPFIQATPAPVSDSVTLYTTPIGERRMLRIERIDTPLDSTDAVEQPLPNPEHDQ